MRKCSVIVGLVMMLVASTVASAVSVGVVPGEWVKAIPADLPNGNTFNADGTPGGWYAGPDGQWGDTPGNPQAAKWYAQGSNGGISEAGTGGWNDLDHYSLWNGDGGSPNIKTVLSGLDPLGLYDVYIVYGVNSNGGGGVWAGLDLGSLTWYQGAQGTDTGLWVPGRTGGDPAPSQYAKLNAAPIQAVGGELTVYNGPGVGNFYDGLTYDRVGTVPEPATMLLLGLGGIGMVARKRRG